MSPPPPPPPPLVGAASGLSASSKPSAGMCKPRRAANDDTRQARSMAVPPSEAYQRVILVMWVNLPPLSDYCTAKSADSATDYCVILHYTGGEAASLLTWPPTRVH